jgi:hypothetical protein
MGKQRKGRVAVALHGSTKVLRIYSKSTNSGVIEGSNCAKGKQIALQGIRFLGLLRVSSCILFFISIPIPFFLLVHSFYSLVIFGEGYLQFLWKLA